MNLTPIFSPAPERVIPRVTVRHRSWRDQIAPELKPDHLPTATEDWLLEYPSLYSRTPDAPCRIRVYRNAAMPTVIVATELPINRGTSITNRAELVFAMAWLLAGRPWPCVFIEHNQHSVEGDRYELVTFEPGDDGRPREVEHWLGGDAVPDLRSFCEVQWRHAHANAVLKMLGSPEPKDGGDERDVNGAGTADQGVIATNAIPAAGDRKAKRQKGGKK